MDRQANGLWVCTKREAEKVFHYKTPEKWQKTEDGNSLIIPDRSVSKMRLYYFETIKNDIESRLKTAFEKEFANFLPVYRELNISREKKTEYARLHALFNEVLKLIETGIEKKQIHSCFIKIGIPKYNNYVYFSKKLKEFDTEKGFLHGNIGNSNALKLDDYVKERIEQYYKDSRKLSVKVITKKLNDELKQDGIVLEISYSAVKKHIQDKEVQNQSYQERHGRKAWYNDKRKQEVFAKPQYIGQYAEADGLPLPFFCFDENKQGYRPCLYAIIDVCSGKITGWSVTMQENRWSIVKALESQCLKASFLPAKIKLDNHSAKKTIEIKDLQSSVLEYGCLIEYARPNHAQDKPVIERFFRTFQDRFCREHKAFTGMAITAKRLDGRRNPEAYNEHIKKYGNPSLNEIKACCEVWIEKYNNTSFDEKPTANELFEGEKYAKLVKIETYQTQLLFNLKTEVTVRQCMISFEIEKQTYYYQLDSEIHNNKPCTVYYDPSDLSEILVEIKNYTPFYLGLYTPMDRDNLAESYARNGKSKKQAREKTLALIGANHLVSKQTVSETAFEIDAEVYGKGNSGTYASKAEPTTDLSDLFALVPKNVEEWD
jgi:transposase InsO family protein